MGHIVFLGLHLLAILFGIVGLVVTIPLHIIYAAIPKKNVWDNWKPTKQCPYCKQKIDKTASKCPYCQEWMPQQEEDSLEEVEPFDEEAENRRLIEESMSQIKEKFSEVTRVEPSPYQFYALVHHNGGSDIVKLGGFNIQKIPKDKLKKVPKVKEWAEGLMNK